MFDPIPSESLGSTSRQPGFTGITSEVIAT